MSNQSTIDMLFLEKDTENPAFRMGLFLSLLVTLMFIWMPVPHFDPLKKSPKPKPLDYRRAIPPELKPEKVELFNLTPATKPTPVPWEIATIDPEVMVNEEIMDEVPAYESTRWESDLNVEPPAPTGTLTLSTPGLEAPVFTRKTPPVYPRLAIKHGLQGYVILEATLTHDGQIEDISILRGLGRNRFGFEDEARKALQQWAFEPGRLNDNPVSVRLVLRIDFKLSK